MHIHTFKNRALSGVASAAFMLAAACGESEDVGPAPSGTASTISGIVADGYLEGATVFLDLNHNYVRDEGEPTSAPTDRNGAFKLHQVGLIADQVVASFLLAEVPDTARDADDRGATLREAGRDSFTLLSPAGAFLPASDAGVGSTDTAVLSPLSTLVSGEMLANGSSVDEAEASVIAALGLENKPLLEDFIASGDAVLHNVARVAALSLGAATRAAGSATDGGVVLPPGHRVVAALQAAREQLPRVVRHSLDAGVWPRARSPRGDNVDGGIEITEPSGSKPADSGRNAGRGNSEGRSGR